MSHYSTDRRGVGGGPNHVKQSTSPHKIIRQIFDELTARGISAKDFAEMLDMESYNVSDVKHNKNRVSLRIAEKFADALGFDVTLTRRQ